MHEEYLKSLGFKNLDEFDEKQQEKLRRILGLANLVLTVPYVKIYQQVISIICREDNEQLWTTRITFAAFVLLDNEAEDDASAYLDHFVVPLRPFKLRSPMERNEMDKLMDIVWEDFDKISDHFNIPDMLEKDYGEA